jgi:hypothetical protein
MDLNHIAPCGIDCVNCELFEANGNRAAWERVAARTGKSVEESACPGCRAGNGCVFAPGTCETLGCSRKRGLDFCSECGDFPCERLQPLADGASFYPHNFKAYNLSVIKARGAEALLAEAPRIRKLYYGGKFALGKGPQET